MGTRDTVTFEGRRPAGAVIATAVCLAVTACADPTPVPVATSSSSPSGSPSGSLASPPPTLSTTTPATLPASLRLPHEGVKGRGGGEEGDWEPQPWQFDACLRSSPTIDLDDASDSRAIEQHALEYLEGEAVAVFADAAEAAAFVAGLVAATTPCAKPAPGLNAVTVVEPLDGAWDEGTILATSYLSIPSGPPEQGVAGRYLFVARSGRAVALFQYSGEFGSPYPRPRPDQVEQFRVSLDSFAPQLRALSR